MKHWLSQLAAWKRMASLERSVEPGVKPTWGSVWGAGKEGFHPGRQQFLFDGASTGCVVFVGKIHKNMYFVRKKKESILAKSPRKKNCKESSLCSFPICATGIYGVHKCPLIPAVAVYRTSILSSSKQKHPKHNYVYSWWTEGPEFVLSTECA